MTRLALLACALLLNCNRAKAPDESPVPPTSGAPSDEIHITTGATTYAPGAAVALTIHNATSRQFAFNPCNRSVEREGHGAVAEPGRVCTMEAWILDPNGTRDASTNLPAGLEPGTYRLSIDFAAQDSTGGRVHATSNPITVQ
jgi:hypothetical protein